MGGNTMNGKSGGFARGVKNVQSVIWVGMFVAGTITSGVLAYVDLVARMDDMQQQIARVTEIAMYQLRSDQWQTKALEHITEKHPGEPPKRPVELGAAYLELLAK